MFITALTVPLFSTCCCIKAELNPTLRERRPSRQYLEIRRLVRGLVKSLNLLHAEDENIEDSYGKMIYSEVIELNKSTRSSLFD
jgi:hypothetical protein